MKTVHISALLILISVFPLKAWSAEVQLQPENLTALVADGLANNPELKASELRWQMFASKVKPAGALDDPMIMLKIQSTPAREPFVFNKDTQSAKVIGISQQLPFWESVASGVIWPAMKPTRTTGLSKNAGLS